MLTEGTKNAKINITLRIKEHRNDTGHLYTMINFCERKKFDISHVGPVII